MANEHNPKINFTHNDYEILNREVLYQGVFRLARYKIRYQLFNGGWSDTVSREVLERLSAAALLPYDPVLDQVVLIEQFRPGALAHPASPWLVEIVAGVLDSGEKPDQVAVREAQEEAGCTVDVLFPICDLFVTPGGSNEYLHIYCGKVDTRNIGGVHGLIHEQEDIRAYTLPAEEAFLKLRAGYIKTAPAIIALQWLQLNRHLLRELWLEEN
jgi:ADP-ribose pyrophosphatase